MQIPMPEPICGGSGADQPREIARPQEIVNEGIEIPLQRRQSGVPTEKNDGCDDDDDPHPDSF